MSEENESEYKTEASGTRKKAPARVQVYAAQEIATKHTWLLTFKLIKIKLNLNFSSSTALVTLWVVSRHVWWVAATLDNADMEKFHHYRKFYWMLLD